MSAIVLTLTSAASNVAGLAFKKLNAPAGDINISPFMCMSRPDNAHGSWPTRQSSLMPSGKERRWKPVRGTEESDRTAPPTPAAIEVCSRAVLPGSGGPKRQTSGAVPQPTDNACSACHHLVELSEEKLDHATLAAEPTLRLPYFSTPTGCCNS